MINVYLANSLGFYKNNSIVDSFAKALFSLLSRESIVINCFNPFPNARHDPLEISELNKKQLEKSNLVILFLDFSGADIDSGVAWEGGYVCGLRHYEIEKSGRSERKIIGITNSIRTTDVGNSVYNIQVMQNLDAVFGVDDTKDISDWIKQNFLTKVSE